MTLYDHYMTGLMVFILVAIDVEFGLKFEGTLRDAYRTKLACLE